MPAIEKAAKELTDRGILHQVRVMSAHRDPEIVAEYARTRACAGFGDHRRSTGLSAALPGVVTAHTDLPVIGGALDVVDLGRGRARTRCSRSRRCRRGCRWRASASTTRARPPPCSPRGSSARRGFDGCGARSVVRGMAACTPSGHRRREAGAAARRPLASWSSIVDIDLSRANRSGRCTSTSAQAMVPPRRARRGAQVIAAPLRRRQVQTRHSTALACTGHQLRVGQRLVHVVGPRGRS